MTVFVETNSRSPISRNDRCVDSSGRSRSSAAVSEDAPTARALIVARLDCSSAGPRGEDAEVRPLLEDVVDLGQDRRGAPGVGERDVGAGHLEKGLD